MVGSAVDRFNCDDNWQEIVGDDSDSGGGHQEATTWADEATTWGGGYGNSTSAISDVDTANVDKCKVAVAVAVTFVGGALQVIDSC